jgi:16S rRNA (guanine527-N7)-methyltransferase
MRGNLLSAGGLAGKIGPSALPFRSGVTTHMAQEDPIIDDSLPAALARHGLTLPELQVARLDRYCRLLWDWNQKLNLTRHTTYEKFVARDLVDSLAFSRAIEPGEDVLDVGTGGGVPGIVLAITRPDISVSLCDSVAKRARVVAEIVRELALHVPVHHGPAQDHVADGLHDTLVVRAVAPLPKLLTWFAPHWDSFRRLLVVKGPAWIEERREARERGLFKGLQLRRLDEYPLAGTHSTSVLLEIRPKEGNDGGERE